MRTFGFITALILFSTITTIAQSQRAMIDGVLDMKFGDSQKQVFTSMKQRTGVKEKKKERSAEQVVFTGGTFAGLKVIRWTMSFHDGKLWNITIDLSASEWADYSRLRGDLESKYGPGQSNSVLVGDYWVRGNGGIDIKNYTGSDKQVQIVYQDIAVAKQVEARREQQERESRQRNAKDL